MTPTFFSCFHTHTPPWFISTPRTCPALCLVCINSTASQAWSILPSISAMEIQQGHHKCHPFQETSPGLPCLIFFKALVRTWDSFTCLCDYGLSSPPWGYSGEILSVLFTATSLGIRTEPGTSQELKEPILTDAAFGCHPNKTSERFCLEVGLLGVEGGHLQSYLVVICHASPQPRAAGLFLSTLFPRPGGSPLL